VKSDLGNNVTGTHLNLNQNIEFSITRSVIYQLSAFSGRVRNGKAIASQSKWVQVWYF